MGHPWLVVILVAVVMCSSWAIVGEAQTFSDLPPNHWGYEGLRDLVRTGLVEEYQQGQALLGPVSLSRYEVALLVGKVHQRLDHYQRKLVEKQLMLGTSMSDANVAQALAALDYTLWEQVFNFTLEHPPGDLTGGRSRQEVAELRRLTARAAQSLENLTREFAEEMELMGLYSRPRDTESRRLAIPKLTRELSPTPEPSAKEQSPVVGQLGLSRIGGHSKEWKAEALWLWPGLEVWVTRPFSETEKIPISLPARGGSGKGFDPTNGEEYLE